MSQLSWTLLGPYGDRYDIGLYHGDRTKHVLVHVNRKPVIIDFSIRKSKKYSFYVGHELCELQIAKEDTEYSYSLKTNKNVDTPLNKLRKEQSRKYFFIAIFFAIFFVLTIITISYLFLKSE